MAKRAKAAFDPKVFLATVNHGRKISRFRKGTVVFQQATRADAVFHVLKGRIKIVVSSSGLVDREAATITLSYALAEDARRVGELLKATPDQSIGGHASDDYASMAFFTYDRQLYDRLRVIRDERMNTIRAAFERGEEVKHAFTDEAVNEPALARHRRWTTITGAGMLRRCPLRSA
jgi:hypothetical protein